MAINRCEKCEGGGIVCESDTNARTMMLSNGEQVRILTPIEGCGLKGEIATPRHQIIHLLELVHRPILAEALLFEYKT